MRSEASHEPSIVRLAGVLLIVTTVVAALLGLTNQITAPLIAQNEQAAVRKALQALVPGEDFTEKTSVNDPNSVVQMVYTSADKQSYCVEVTPNGFSGEIDMIVGIQNGTVTGIQILSMTETPGLGVKAKEPAFADQYQGVPADGNLAVSKDGGTIQAITGATITSRAITSGVNAACAYVAGLSQGGSAT